MKIITLKLLTVCFMLITYSSYLHAQPLSFDQTQQRTTWQIVNAADIEDFNKDGYGDIIVNMQNRYYVYTNQFMKSQDDSLIFIRDDTAAVQMNFTNDPAKSSPLFFEGETTKGSPEMLLHDFNGDGFKDILGGSRALDNLTQNNHVYVVLNNATATPLEYFNNQISWVGYVAGGEPNYVFFDIGDFNNDGKMDIAATHRDPTTAPQSGINAPTPEWTEGERNLTIFLNTSEGGNLSFANPIRITYELHPDFPVVEGFAPTIRDITAGDVNNDGKDDVIFALATPGGKQPATIEEANLFYFENTTADGSNDVTFSQKFDVFTNLFTYAVTVNDVNGDGENEVLLVNKNDQKLYVWHLDAAGTLTELLVSPVILDPVADADVFVAHIKAADLNLDGLNDLAWNYGGAQKTESEINAARFTILQNISTDGTLAFDFDNIITNEVLQSSGYGSGDRPGFAIGDVNNDGKPDIVGGAPLINPWYTFLNTTVTEPSITSLSATVGGVGSVVTINGELLGSVTEVVFNGDPAIDTDDVVLSAEDLNSVSATSITLTVPAGAETGTITVRTPGGEVSSEVFTVVEAPVISSVSPLDIEVGQDLTILGDNLAAVERVIFDGDATDPADDVAVEVDNITVNTDGSLTLTVPTGAQSGKVRVLTPGGAAVSTEDLTILLPTSLDDLINGVNISIYPNPASQQLNIKFGEISEIKDVRVSLVNMMGRKIYAKEFKIKSSNQEANILTSTYPKGVYILTIESKLETIEKKILIQ